MTDFSLTPDILLTCLSKQDTPLPVKAIKSLLEKEHDCVLDKKTVNSLLYSLEKSKQTVIDKTVSPPLWSCGTVTTPVSITPPRKCIAIFIRMGSSEAGECIKQLSETIEIKKEIEVFGFASQNHNGKISNRKKHITGFKSETPEIDLVWKLSELVNTQKDTNTEYEFIVVGYYPVQDLLTRMSIKSSFANNWKELSEVLEQ